MSVLQEKAAMGCTLAGLINGITNKRTTVELRNESFVTGKVLSSDGFMNISMSDAVFTDARGNKQKFPHFFVQSRLIRYVQIPPDVDMMKTLSEQVSMGERGRGGPGRGRGVSRHRQKIMDEREVRRQEDLKNAFKMREEWKKAKAAKEERETNK